MILYISSNLRSYTTLNLILQHKVVLADHLVQEMQDNVVQILDQSVKVLSESSRVIQKNVVDMKNYMLVI